MVFSWLRDLTDSARRRFRSSSDPAAQLESINNALEDGDYQRVFEETDRILSDSSRIHRLRRGPLRRAMFFNSSEEYRNYVRRNPTQSYVVWEFPLAPEAHFHRALAFERSGRLQSSKKEVEKSLSQFPNSAKYLTELGYILVSMRAYFDAERRFDQAIANDLTDEQLYHCRAQIGKALACMEMGNFEKTTRILTQVRRIWPENREAISYLNLAAELGNDPRQRAQYFLGLGAWEAAITTFSEALEINAADFEMHLGIAYAYKELRKLQKAEKHIRQAFKYNPMTPEVNFALGWVYLIMGKLEQAEVELHLAIKKNRYDPGHFVGLGYVYLEQLKGDSQSTEGKLISAARKATELDPNYADPYILLADYYLSVEQPKQAKKFIYRAIRLSPENQEAHILAAELYLQAGNKRLTLHHLNEAADFGQDTDQMRELRSRLEGESF